MSSSSPNETIPSQFDGSRPRKARRLANPNPNTLPRPNLSYLPSDPSNLTRTDYHRAFHTLLNTFAPFSSIPKKTRRKIEYGEIELFRLRRIRVGHLRWFYELCFGGSATRFSKKELVSMLGLKYSDFGRSFSKDDRVDESGWLCAHPARHEQGWSGTEVCGCLLCRDVMVLILEFCGYDSSLLQSVALINEDWYLVVLSSWSSLVFRKKSTSPVTRVPLIVLRSIRYLTVERVLAVPDWDYLFRKVDRCRIQSIFVGSQNRISGLKSFFSSLSKVANEDRNRARRRRKKDPFEERQYGCKLTGLRRFRIHPFTYEITSTTEKKYGRTSYQYITGQQWDLLRIPNLVDVMPNVERLDFLPKWSVCSGLVRLTVISAMIGSSVHLGSMYGFGGSALRRSYYRRRRRSRKNRGREKSFSVDLPESFPPQLREVDLRMGCYTSDGVWEGLSSKCEIGGLRSLAISYGEDCCHRGWQSWKMDTKTSIELVTKLRLSPGANLHLSGDFSESSDWKLAVAHCGDLDEVRLTLRMFYVLRSQNLMFSARRIILPFQRWEFDDLKWLMLGFPTCVRVQLGRIPLFDRRRSISSLRGLRWKFLLWELQEDDSPTLRKHKLEQFGWQ